MRMIRDQMSNLDDLLACICANFVASVLVFGHTVNILVLGDDNRFEEEGYKRDKQKLLINVKT